MTAGDEGEEALERAKSYVTPEGRRVFRLPAGDTIPAAVLVHDERVCERAGRAYGGPGSPPRRVVVVSVGGLFVVYDPFEPLPAGEWNIWEIYDRGWHLLCAIAG